MSGGGIAAHEPDLEAIREDVAVLANIARSSARPGELRSAGWLGERLREMGAADVQLQPYRYQHTYALAHGLHDLAGMLAAARGGARGAAFALATLRSYEREVSGRSQWLRWLLPAGGGANVVARVPAHGKRRGTVVLVAHHDAANTGLVWHPRVVAAGAGRHLARRRVDPFMGPIELAFTLVIGGSLLSHSRGRGRARRAGRLARGLGGSMLALSALLDLDVARSETVPGACDNASGVGVCLELTRALLAEPLAHVEVVIALTGSEEAGMGGMGAFLDAHASELLQHPRFVLGLDTLGAGRAIVCEGEGAMREQGYHERDIAIVEEGAASAGVEAPQRWRIGAWTDPILAVHRGLPAASLLSMGPGYFPHYHHPSDTVDEIDWGSVEGCARIAAGTLGVLEGRLGRGGWG